MAATHLEARAARVHVRVKVFEELLAAFRQQCRRTLRHLGRLPSAVSSYPPTLGAFFVFFLDVFRSSFGLDVGGPEGSKSISFSTFFFDIF